MLMTWMAAFFRRIVRRRRRGVIEAFRFFPHEAATDETFEGAQFAVIFIRHETDGVANLIRAAGATDAVDVILDVHRKIVVHDV